MAADRGRLDARRAAGTRCRQPVRRRMAQSSSRTNQCRHSPRAPATASSRASGRRESSVVTPRSRHRWSRPCRLDPAGEVAADRAAPNGRLTICLAGAVFSPAGSLPLACARRCRSAAGVCRRCAARRSARARPQRPDGRPIAPRACRERTDPRAANHRQAALISADGTAVGSVLIDGQNGDIVVLSTGGDDEGSANAEYHCYLIRGDTPRAWLGEMVAQAGTSFWAGQWMTSWTLVARET